MIIEQIFTSPGHNFVGHYGEKPRDFPVVEADKIECVAGRGIRGDRYFDFRQDYKGQITFFSREVFDLMSKHFGLTNKSPGVLRRNVIVSGVDLMGLIGVDFVLQGIQFRGTAHCAPCLWMETAVAPGAEKFLAGRGGLRARIFTDRWLAAGDAELQVLKPSRKIA